MEISRRGFLGIVSGTVGAAILGKFIKPTLVEGTALAKVCNVNSDGDLIIAGERLYSGDLAVVGDDGVLQIATHDNVIGKPLRIVLKNALPGERTESTSAGKCFVNI